MDSHQNSLPERKEQGREALVVELSQQLTWSRKEAAAMCGVSATTFSKWVRAGEMCQPLKCGRFSSDAVRKWFAVKGADNEPETGYDRWKKLQ